MRQFKVKIETGHCNLRAAPTNQTVNLFSSGAQKALTKRLSTKDFKKFQQSQSVTTLQIPRLVILITDLQKNYHRSKGIRALSF
jgi:hypothetical protein